MNKQLILHIGMGKTGTSSIQEAFSANSDDLRTQGVCYLGMWFDAINPDYAGIDKQINFFSLPPEDMVKAARKLCAFVQASNCRKFIVSNESLWGRPVELEPFIRELLKDIDVKIIAYVRDPKEWLPSAYTQWGIYDRLTKNSTRDYQNAVASFINWYNPVYEWHKRMGDIISIRKYTPRVDAVADFSKALGVDLKCEIQKVNERRKAADLLLRAIFNDRFQGRTPPRLFEEYMLDKNTKVHGLRRSLKRYFDYSSTQEAISQNGKVFDFIKSKYGISFDEGEKKSEPLNENEVRNDVIDIMMEIMVSQSIRIRNLEAAVEEIRSSASI
ncbi:sulfotransferase domain-containing protein [Paracoccus versutus]|uniref:sulfotransferase domain-containing protein n=1 Tax=Paracoccus versutus TaxID=34007 RepID=UPI000DF7903D|nr:sulfotransferase domain-containing protein [Paracoccus versutus]MCJ1903413.1 sulfotransferase domain-containing protein [Paracoccus versutus]RDD69385.1 hypothetical protein DVR11_21505 [Paracoccus versutus]